MKKTFLFVLFLAATGILFAQEPISPNQNPSITTNNPGQPATNSNNNVVSPQQSIVIHNNTQPSHQQPVNAENVELIPGTPVQVQLVSTINTDEEVKGTRAVVASNVYDNAGFVIIRAGSEVILDVKKRNNGPLGRPAELYVKCLSTRAVDGQPVWLDGELNLTGEARRGAAFGRAFGLGLTVLPGFGLLFLLTHGTEVVVPKGTYINYVTISLPPLQD